PRHPRREVALVRARNQLLALAEGTHDFRRGGDERDHAHGKSLPDLSYRQVSEVPMAHVSRRRFLTALIAIPAGVALFPSLARAEHYAAMLCGDCGFGSKKDNCAKCGKW